MVGVCLSVVVTNEEITLVNQFFHVLPSVRKFMCSSPSSVCATTQIIDCDASNHRVIFDVNSKPPAHVVEDGLWPSKDSFLGPSSDPIVRPMIT